LWWIAVSLLLLLLRGRRLLVLILTMISTAVATSGRRLSGSSRRSFLPQHQFYGNMRIKVVVFLELHICATSSTLENGKTDLRRVLVVAAQLRHGKDTFDDLSLDDGIFTKAR
jgi:hypothetical protein